MYFSVPRDRNLGSHFSIKIQSWANSCDSMILRINICTRLPPRSATYPLIESPGQDNVSIILMRLLLYLISALPLISKVSCADGLTAGVIISKQYGRIERKQTKVCPSFIDIRRYNSSGEEECPLSIHLDICVKRDVESGFQDTLISRTPGPIAYKWLEHLFNP